MMLEELRQNQKREEPKDNSAEMEKENANLVWESNTSAKRVDELEKKIAK